ncbi:Alpha/beta-Hydrolases superfamily protein isoform 1 [Dorcoceras hygrometricum]|uniref:Alpha/beta-Hydrolases superfamily protein isoform 1 n=1 Tax=Dorcoceras hygrometricum TaxID=472368 RepID=A0A2Z7CBV9_9LAMI|nr:Alpha/beta-Hydrolases superfamily protein isoform 1 [Dorcoceras hygrometricum]
MAVCFSFTASRDMCFRYSFSSAGLKSTATDLGEGTVMHCWGPKSHKPGKPTLLLIHGIGANAMWQWNDFVSPLSSKFNVYVRDLLFFGESYTSRTDRSDSFQAQCVMRMMEALGVGRMRVVGLSYGGFVAYSMAAQFPDAVERVVICCAGVCSEEKDLEEGLFRVKSVDEAISILLAQTPDKLRELMKLSFYKPINYVPSCFLSDFIQNFGFEIGSIFQFIDSSWLSALLWDTSSWVGGTVPAPVMCTENLQERKELIYALHKDRKLSDLPKIMQPTLIIWGEHDQIFPLELAHRLKRHLEHNSQLVILKNAGHAINMEKPKELYSHIVILECPASSSG